MHPAEDDSHIIPKVDVEAVLIVLLIVHGKKIGLV